METAERVGRAAWCRKEGNNNFYAISEDESETIEETLDNDEDVEPWCLLEESENEQWQEVISIRVKQKARVCRTVKILAQRKSVKSRTGG